MNPTGTEDKNAAIQLLSHMPVARSADRSVPIIAEDAAGKLVENSLTISESLTQLTRNEEILLNPVALAGEVLQILRRLVAFETDYYHFQDGLEEFLYRMCSEKSIENLFSELIRDSQTVLLHNEQSKGSFVPARIFSDLWDILNWYGRRKKSLTYLTDFESDSIFDLRVLYDRELYGYSGLVVRSGINIYGRVNQQLWVKLELTQNGKAIATNPGWECWSDNTESYVLQLANSQPTFAAILPITIKQYYSILDNVSLFIPYAALKIPTQAENLELQLTLIGEDGKEIVDRKVSLYLPRVMTKELEISSALSPQGVGYWPEDPVTNNKISNVRIKKGVRRISGKDSVVLSVFSDLELFGYGYEPLNVKITWLDEDGELINGNVISESIIPQKPIFRCKDFSVQIPVEFFADEHITDNSWLEVLVTDSSEQIIVGTLAALSSDMVSDHKLCSIQPTQSANKNLSAQVVAPISLIKWHVDQNSYLGQESSVRIESIFKIDQDCFEHFKLAISIEDRDGKPLHNSSFDEERLLRVYDLANEGESRSFKVITHFLYSSLCNLECGESSPEIVLTLFSSDDNIIVSHRSRIDLNIDPATTPSANDLNSVTALSIADISDCVKVEMEALVLNVTLDIDTTSLIDYEGLIYSELVDGQGQSLLLATGVANSEDLLGNVTRVDVNQILPSDTRFLGMYQSNISIQHSVSDFINILLERSIFVKVMLFSSDGRLIQCVKQPVAIPTGMLTSYLKLQTVPEKQEEERSYRERFLSFLLNLRNSFFKFFTRT